MADCSTAVYRPRRPEKSALYQAVVRNLDLFYERYDDRFLAQHGPLSARAVKTLEGFGRCGRVAFGLSRARCDACGNEFLVAFSCQLRGVCPSCQQKRAEVLCRFVVDAVIAPVDHRQLVFVLPKMLRSAFHRDRELLRGLCRAAVDATQAFYRAGLDRKDLSVGMMVVPQLFGDRLNAHVHLHALASDGAFDPDGQFHRMPFGMQHDIKVLQRLFERRVLDMMVKHKRLSERLRDDILSWQHTGFSVDGSVRVMAGDHPKLLRLVRYIARPAVSFERISYDDSTGNVTVRSAKKTGGLRPVVAQYDVLTFIALLTLQVPPPGTHMVRYFGWYSSRSRAARQTGAKMGETSDSAPPTEVQPPGAKERRRRWAQLIRQVFEVDPLACTRCGAEMKIVSFITPSQPEVLHKILDHLGEETEPRATGPPKWLQILQAQEQMDEHPECYPEEYPDWDGDDSQAA